MAQVSTGMGLAILGGCILGAAVISSHRLGDEAFAQGTGTERRIVSAGVYGLPHANAATSEHFAYRIWSDNTIDVRCLGKHSNYGNGGYTSSDWSPALSGNFLGWQTVDNGTSGFRPLTDVDMSGETDAGDISQVLLDFNSRSDDLPPPPIDCTINSPR